jgi:hypothetical protein
MIQSQNFDKPSSAVCHKQKIALFQRMHQQSTTKKTAVKAVDPGFECKALQEEKIADRSEEKCNMFLLPAAF